MYDSKYRFFGFSECWLNKVTWEFVMSPFHIFGAFYKQNNSYINSEDNQQINRKSMFAVLAKNNAVSFWQILNNWNYYDLMHIKRQMYRYIVIYPKAP